ncbi:MAG: GNAT family N-acetyltransferase [bacterium]
MAANRQPGNGKNHKRSDIQIVEASGAAQVQQIHELFGEYADSLGFDLDFQQFAAELDGLPGEYEPPRGVLLLARVSGDPGQTLGCVALRPLAGTVCEMKRLYVRPAGRGRGIGRLLAEAVIAAARQRGYGTMRLDTVAAMTAANTLYASLGFRRIGSYRYNPLPDAVYFELVL